VVKRMTLVLVKQIWEHTFHLQCTTMVRASTKPFEVCKLHEHLA
jgi:hypothetical protein